MRLIVFTLVLILLAIPSLADTLTIEGKVIKVADGDTITVLDSNKEQHRVRLAGIDAPEKGQPFRNASRKRLGELVALKEVRVEFNKYDRCGRINSHPKTRGAASRDRVSRFVVCSRFQFFSAASVRCAYRRRQDLP
jgi:endonuclease YncB( thermonuclease family)